MASRNMLYNCTVKLLLLLPQIIIFGFDGIFTPLHSLSNDLKITIAAFFTAATSFIYLCSFDPFCMV